MPPFRCRACQEQGTFTYDGRHACPRCGSPDVQFALGIEEIPDDHPLIEAMTELRKSRGTGRLVVVTHHAPMPGRGYRLAPLYPGTKLTDEEILTAAYRSDLTSLMSPAPDDGCGALQPADVWIYGHTHQSEDVTIGHTRVVSNAKGYGPWLPHMRTWDSPDFDPNFVIEI
jgi:hypothetical protein